MVEDKMEVVKDYIQDILSDVFRSMIKPIIKHNKNILEEIDIILKMIRTNKEIFFKNNNFDDFYQSLISHIFHYSKNTETEIERIIELEKEFSKSKNEDNHIDFHEIESIYVNLSFGLSEMPWDIILGLVRELIEKDEEKYKKKILYVILNLIKINIENENGNEVNENGNEVSDKDKIFNKINVEKLKKEWKILKELLKKYKGDKENLIDNLEPFLISGNNIELDLNNFIKVVDFLKTKKINTKIYSENQEYLNENFPKALNDLFWSATLESSEKIDLNNLLKLLEKCKVDFLVDFLSVLDRLSINGKNISEEGFKILKLINLCNQKEIGRIQEEIVSIIVFFKKEKIPWDKIISILNKDCDADFFRAYIWPHILENKIDNLNKEEVKKKLNFIKYLKSQELFLCFTKFGMYNLFYSLEKNKVEAKKNNQDLLKFSTEKIQNKIFNILEKLDTKNKFSRIEKKEKLVNGRTLILSFSPKYNEILPSVFCSVLYMFYNYISQNRSPIFNKIILTSNKENNYPKKYILDVLKLPKEIYQFTEDKEKYDTIFKNSNIFFFNPCDIEKVKRFGISIVSQGLFRNNNVASRFISNKDYLLFDLSFNDKNINEKSFLEKILFEVMKNLLKLEEFLLKEKKEID